MKTKVCTKCKKEFPLSNNYYYSDSSHSDGFKSACKNCMKNPRKIHKKECKMCKSEYQSKRSDSVFCSKKCKNQFHHIFNRCSWYLCKHCGNMFPTWNINPDKRGRFFCSIECKNKYFNRSIYKKKFICNQYSYQRTKRLDKWKNDILNLNDVYVIGLLTKRTNLNVSDIKNNRELIEAKREQIKLFRLIKQIEQ